MAPIPSWFVPPKKVAWRSVVKVELKRATKDFGPPEFRGWAPPAVPGKSVETVPPMTSTSPVEG